MGIKLKEITYMTREEAEDNYRIKWEKQIKKDMADNSALRARQRPIRPLGASQEGGSRGGKASKKRPYVSIR
jgi:hypothetical protein|tara:strand:+ start:47 stop:262 length:216 start_codon:yes stop_codon:yes gene_type:complete